MGRALRALCSVLCVALFLVMSALTVRSYRVGDLIRVARATASPRAVGVRDVNVGSASGRIVFSVYDANYSRATFDARPASQIGRVPPGRPTWSVHRPDAVLAATDNERPGGWLGFRLYTVTPWPNQQSVTAGAVPTWPILVALASWPVARLTVAVRKFRRRRAGRCTACGYDLRASPERRCPECGRVDVPCRLNAAPTIGALAGLLLVSVGAVAFALGGAVPAPIGARDVSTARPLSTGAVRMPQLALQSNRGPLPPAPLSPSTWPTAGRGPTPWTPLHARELAAKVDPHRTYVFVWMEPGVERPRHGLIRIQIFARANNRWSEDIVYLRVGDRVQGGRVSTAYTISEIRPEPTGDIVVTFVGPAGQVVETHSAAADYNDPIRHLLAFMPSHMGAEAEDELFRSK